MVFETSDGTAAKENEQKDELGRYPFSNFFFLRLRRRSRQDKVRGPKGPWGQSDGVSRREGNQREAFQRSWIGSRASKAWMAGRTLSELCPSSTQGPRSDPGAPPERLLPTWFAIRPRLRRET